MRRPNLKPSIAMSRTKAVAVTLGLVGLLRKGGDHGKERKGKEEVRNMYATCGGFEGSGLVRQQVHESLVGHFSERQVRLHGWWRGVY
jgi:hypothetical protein